MLSCFSRVQLCVTPWTVACWAPLSTGFSRQEYWSELACPSPGVPWWLRALKRLPPMQETPVRFLGWDDPLEKEMVTHSSILAWRIPWMEEPGRLQSTGSQRVGHDWATSLSLSLSLGVSSQPRDWTRVSCIAGGFFTIWATREGGSTIEESRESQRRSHGSKFTQLVRLVCIQFDSRTRDYNHHFWCCESNMKLSEKSRYLHKKGNKNMPKLTS